MVRTNPDLIDSLGDSVMPVGDEKMGV